MIQKHTNNVLVVSRIIHIIYFRDQFFKHIQCLIIVRSIRRRICQHPVCFLIDLLLRLFLFFFAHAVFRRHHDCCDLIATVIGHIGKLFQPEQVTVITAHCQICQFHFIDIRRRDLHLFFPVHDSVQNLIIDKFRIVRQRVVSIFIL